MSAGLQNVQRGDGWYVCSFRDFFQFDNPLRLQFWSTSIVDAAIQVVGFFCLQESQFTQPVVLVCVAHHIFLSFSSFALGEEGREDQEVDGRREGPSQRSTNNI